MANLGLELRISLFFFRGNKNPETRCTETFADLSLSITLQRRNIINHLPLKKVLSWKNSQRHISPFQSERQNKYGVKRWGTKMFLNWTKSIHEENNGELLFFDAKIKFWKPVVLEWKLKAFNVIVSAPRSHWDTNSTVIHRCLQPTLEPFVQDVTWIAFEYSFSSLIPKFEVSSWFRAFTINISTIQQH